MKKCPFCSAEFEADEDFKQHLITFGWDKEKHLRKLEETHRKEWENIE